MAHGQTQITGKDDAQKLAVEAFKALVDSKKSDDKSITSATVFLSIWEAYQSAQNIADNDLQLSDSEELEVLEAVATGVSRADLLKTGLLSQARKVKSQAGKLEALKTSIATGQDNITTTIKGSADLRIDRAVKAVFTHNDCQSDIGSQWFMTATAIQKLTNCNMPAIKSYLANHQSEIDTHHKKHGLTEDTNRGRKGRSIMEEVVFKPLKPPA